jgi:CDP-paratose 2-epimerase
VTSNPVRRPFDLPWIVLDAAKADRVWGWRPQTSTVSILEEIGAHARDHPNWLELSQPM